MGSGCRGVVDEVTFKPFIKMDRIIKKQLDEFVLDNGLASKEEDVNFELFTGYLVTSSHYTETFESNDIHVGKGGDCGIDTISIIVNGCLITEVQEIEDLEGINGYLDVLFIFNQAERSSNFDSSKVGQFSYGCNDFFSESPLLNQNADIKKKHAIFEQIYSKSNKFKKGNPQLFLYYCTTGKWTGDQNLTVRKNSVIKDLMDLNSF